MYRKFIGLVLFLLFSFHRIEGAIYDCFLFFNEDELLRVHLEELYEHVDYFVIVEANQTFSGKSKEFRFPKIKNAYEKYLDKIIYVPVDKQIQGDDPWIRERFQRDQIARGLVQCQKRDIIIIGDLDEIVKSRHLDAMISRLQQEAIPVLGCHCDFYRWFLNRKDMAPWIGPAITTFEVLHSLSPEEVRARRSSYAVQQQSAWHFSNVGGLQVYVEKIRSFSHFSELEADYTERHPDELYSSIKGLFSLVPIDESFPEYIRNNQQYYLENNFIDTENGKYY